MHATTTHRLTCLLDGAFRHLAVRATGAPGAPVVVCVHGITRTARDFDVLAQHLAGSFHVLAPDLPGRGDSDWLDRPDQYGLPAYLQALSHVFAYAAAPVCYIGTSLGGICALHIAATRGHPIRRLVLNDIGGLVPRAALERIRDYLCAPVPRFPDIPALKRYLRRVHAPFGPLTDAQWLRLAADSARPLPDGGVGLHYDPAIADAYAANPITDLDLWACWDALDIPTLVLRGEHSDVLTAPVLDRMKARAATRVIADTGHAPALLDAPTIAAVHDFLAACLDEKSPA